jgi:hypothetical protein
MTATAPSSAIRVALAKRDASDRRQLGSILRMRSVAPRVGPCDGLAISGVRAIPFRAIVFLSQS